MTVTSIKGPYLLFLGAVCNPLDASSTAPGRAPARAVGESNRGSSRSRAGLGRRQRCMIPPGQTQA